MGICSNNQKSNHSNQNVNNTNTNNKNNKSENQKHMKNNSISKPGQANQPLQAEDEEFKDLEEWEGKIKKLAFYLR